MKFSNILKVFKKDWFRVFKNKFATFLMISLMLMPSLYAWFNIKALWDPFSNTSELPVAVYSEDQTMSLNGRDINLGDDIKTSLSNNDSLGWKFVSSKKALDEGVKSGKYYAGITIEKDFTKSLLGFMDGNIQKPKIEYRVNTKINAIAPRITDSAANKIKEEVIKQFNKTTSAVLVKAFNDIGYKIDENLPMLNKVKSMVLKADDELPLIDEYAQKIVDLNQKMPQIKAKINDVMSLIDYLPEVDSAANKLVKLNDNMPTIKEKLKIILTLEDEIPNLKAAAKQVNDLDKDMGKVSKTLSSAISAAKKAIKVLDEVQRTLPELKQLMKDGKTFANKAEQIGKKLQGSLDTIANSVGTILKSLSSIADDVIADANRINNFLDSHKLTDTQKDQINKIVQKIDNQLKGSVKVINNIVSLLQQINNSRPNPSDKINDAITKLNTIKGIAQKIIPVLDGFDAHKLNEEQIKAKVNKIKTLASQVKGLADAIDVNSVKKDVKSLLGSMIKTAQDAKKFIDEAEKIDFNGLIKSTRQTVKDALSLMNKYQKELPAIKKEIHHANQMVQKNLPKVISAIKKGASFYRNKLPELEKKLAKIAGFIKNDWPDMEAELVLTASTIKNKLPEVERGLSFASNFIEHDWKTIKNGIQDLAKAVKKIDKNVDFHKLIKALKGDVQKESNFFADPVEIVEEKIYPMPNNGTASTPFYTALALWVGAVLISSVTKADYEKDAEDDDYSDREMYLGRWMTYVVIGLIQAFIVSLGNYYLLGVGVKEFGYSLLFAAIISVCFTTIVYALATCLGTVGKGAAIILLILSVAGGGGNYPIQVSGPFFNFINPLLPFTYSCDLLREAIGGIYWPNATHYLLIITLFFIGGLVIGTLLYPKAKNVRAYVEEEYEKSQLFK